jgi:hypothetical protein
MRLEQRAHERPEPPQARHRQLRLNADVSTSKSTASGCQSEATAVTNPCQVAHPPSSPLT